MVAVLAPVAPPCFDSRSGWVEYLRDAARAHGHQASPLVFTRGVIAVDVDADLSTAQRTGVTPLLLIDKGREVRFNPAFDFCDECDAAFSTRKARAGLCKPTYLRDLLAPSKEPNP